MMLADPAARALVLDFAGLVADHGKGIFQCMREITDLRPCTFEQALAVIEERIQLMHDRLDLARKIFRQAVFPARANTGQ